MGNGGRKADEAIAPCLGLVGFPAAITENRNYFHAGLNWLTLLIARAGRDGSPRRPGIIQLEGPATLCFRAGVWSWS